MSNGYDALRSRAAWLDLTGRGILFASGGDRKRLLHAISTNHIERLEPGESCYAFFLNAQGKILADADILSLPDRLLIDTEPETREKLLRHIDKYIIADDVALEDASDRLAVIAIEGPEAAAWNRVAGEDAVVAPFSSTGAPGLRIYLPRERREELVAGLQGMPQAIPEDQRVVRIENGKPRYGEDIAETTLPQESGQMHAVSFNKGCYLGQEIVERIRARGHVHHKLERLEYAPGHPPEGARITSEAWSPGLGRMVALGYVRVV